MVARWYHALYDHTPICCRSKRIAARPLHDVKECLTHLPRMPPDLLDLATTSARCNNSGAPRSYADVAPNSTIAVRWPPDSAMMIVPRSAEKRSQEPDLYKTAPRPLTITHPRSPEIRTSPLSSSPVNSVYHDNEPTTEHYWPCRGLTLTGSGGFFCAGRPDSIATSPKK